MYSNIIRCQELYDDMCYAHQLNPDLLNQFSFDDKVYLFVSWANEFLNIEKKRASDPDWDWIGESETFFTNKLIETFMEESTMEKNYTTLRVDFGSMPLPGYIAELNQKICRLDGWDVISFLENLRDVTNDMFTESENNDWNEQKAFVILSYNLDSSMELQWEILYDLDNSEKKFDYDTHYYRIYTKDQDWGLDEIEPVKEKEEYELVKVKVFRECTIKETAELYISVKKGFGEDAKEEAEHYVANSYCGHIEWEREDDCYEEEGDIQIDESWIEDTDTKEELECSYDIDETLEY